MCKIVIIEDDIDICNMIKNSWKIINIVFNML